MSWWLLWKKKKEIFTMSEGNYTIRSESNDMAFHKINNAWLNGLTVLTKIPPSKIEQNIFQVKINNSQPFKQYFEWKVIEMRSVRVDLGIYKVMQGWAYETKSCISDIQPKKKKRKKKERYAMNGT